MNIADMIKNAANQIIEPETDALAHVRDFSSMREHLQEAETDYAEAVKTFEDTNPGSRYIMDIASQTNKSGEVLISRALTLATHYQATREDKELANQIIDRITKDASIREKTCSQYYRFMKEANPNARELIAAILKEKQKIMHFLDRCIRTQSVYLRKFEKGEDQKNSKQEQEIRDAAKAERERNCVPEGSHYRPPMPFAPERVPWDQDVPDIPGPYRAFVDIEPEEKVFNVEHQNFELPEDYLSEDGLIDGESVKFDYENHEVTMKYRGGVPVTWPFRQFIDTREVPKPGEWFTEYYLRLQMQEDLREQVGVLQHRPNEGDIPEYEKIPEVRS